MKLALVLFLAAALASCAPKTNVKNLPPGVSNTQVNHWLSATTDLQRAQSLTHAALQTVFGLNHATPPVIPDGKGYTDALTAIGHAQQIEIEAAQFLQTVPNNWSVPVTTKITDFTTQILAQLAAANASGVLNVKDPSTGAAITNAILKIQQVIQLIQQAAAGTSARLIPQEHEVMLAF